MTSRGGRSPHGPRITSVDQVMPRHRGRTIWLSFVFLAALAGTAASGETAQGRTILAAVQRFMLFYAGVFALIALTATVGIGLAATDRIVMVPSTRVVAQAVHRAVSLAALGFLVIHIVTEILAHRSRVIDAFIPFLAQKRTFYIGLGTIASDLMLVLIVTGLARSRFVGKWPWTWRAIHATAYLCWVFSIAHGLLGGRTAKPYVDWSYGACGAAIMLALIIRVVATVRDRRETTAQPVRASAPSSVPAAMSALAPLQFQAARTARQGANSLYRAPRRALPAASADSSPAQVRGAYPQQPRRSYPYTERGRPGAPSYRPPGHPGPSAYAPGYAGGPAAAPYAYQQPPGAGAPPRPPRLALPAGESSAQRPYAPSAYRQPGNPAAARPQPPYAQPPHAQRPYPGPPSTGRPSTGRPSTGRPSTGPGQPPVEHYLVLPQDEYDDSDDPYQDDEYPDDPYAPDFAAPDFADPDFSAPGPELWPEHPSGPIQVYRPVSDSPEYPPSAEPEWP